MGPASPSVRDLAIRGPPRAKNNNEPAGNMPGATRTCAGLSGLVRARVVVGRPSASVSTPPPAFAYSRPAPASTQTLALSRLASTSALQHTTFWRAGSSTPRLGGWASTCRAYRSTAEQPPPDRPEPAPKPHSTEHAAVHATASPVSLPGSPPSSQSQPPAATPSAKVGAPGDVSRAEDVSDKEQSRRDWEIIKTLIPNIWPKDDCKTKIRVLVALGLLVGGKVSLDWTGRPALARAGRWRAGETILGARVLTCPSSYRWCRIGAQRSSSVFFQEHHRRAQRARRPDHPQRSVRRRGNRHRRM